VDVAGLLGGIEIGYNMLLWAFCDSEKLVIVDAESAEEALDKAEKYWCVGQTITPLGALPLNAPDLIGKPIYPFDHALWHANNEFFFDRKWAELQNFDHDITKA